jgi:4-hydroxybenzoate polyprenyltransferase/phosphoserine phosphatase
VNTASKLKRLNDVSNPSLRVATGALTPICVDLDGTLVNTDTLVETLAIFIKKRPDALRKLPLWLLQGKHNFKRQIAKRVKIDPTLMPYNQEVLAYLKEMSEKGHDIYLVTGANQGVAASVAQYLGIFKGVYASSKKVNLVGNAKAQLLNTIFGEKNYIYLGNSSDDLAVWRNAKEAIVVNASSRVLNTAKNLTTVSRVIDKNRVKPKLWLKSIRIHQWTKNLLLLAPIFLANQHISFQHLLNGFLAFLSFSLVASAGYVFNDFLDINSDRKHKTKSARPFASGKVSLQLVPKMLAGLFLAGVGVSLLLPAGFTAIILLYFAATVSYTLWLKRIAIVDVISLAFFYSLRLYAGGEANSIDLSVWLFAFSSFFFLSLALIKRTSELKTSIDLKQAATLSRGYLIKDNKRIKFLGKLSGAMSILVLGYYIFSETAVEIYKQPWILFSVCALLGFWLARCWRLSEDGELDHDPVSFAIRDKISYIVAAGVALSWILARGF